jgi:transposase
MAEDPDEYRLRKAMERADPMRVPDALEKIEWRLMHGEYKAPSSLGLVGHITKHGDAYLRRLLVQGARSVLHTAPRHTDHMSQWVQAIESRRGHHRALVAIASKNARIAWAVLSRNEALRPA